MAMRSAQLEAMYVRRREQEFNRVQRTQAQSRYYDHWDQVNSRFENWTAPEYYNKVEEKLKQQKEQSRKQEQLAERREKLKSLILAEKLAYEAEAERRKRPRSRHISVDTDTLQRVDQQAKERENIRRKLQLEAKLYGRWRHGADDENAIFNSKSDNEVLAKLNWLDKQVAEEMQREKDEAMAQERNLRMQEELVKYEQTQKERQMIREQEIKEMRALQERHMDELSKRQQEAELLKAEEKHMRLYQEELQKEMELLDESAAVAAEPAELSHAYNLKKIKLFIRKRSDMFRGQIKLAMGILERLREFALKNDVLKSLYDKYKEQLEVEKHTISQIEAMYESEAKYNLQRCEESWQSQQTERYHEMKQLLLEIQSSHQMQLNENLERQAELIEIRTAHLAAIENSNEKLKILINEEENSPRNHCAFGEDALDAAAKDCLTITQPANVAQSPRPIASAAATASTSRISTPKLTNSFNNLNLDGWKDLQSAPGGIDSPRLLSSRAMQVVTPDTAERPRFARKRVAWT